MLWPNDVAPITTKNEATDSLGLASNAIASSIRITKYNDMHHNYADAWSHKLTAWIR